MKRNTNAENAEISDLVAQAMEKLYGGDGANMATFKKRGRGGLLTNMLGDMANEGWWTVPLNESIEYIKTVF